MPFAKTQSVSLREDAVLDEEALSWNAWFNDLPLAEKQVWVAQLAALLAGLQAYPYPSGRAGNLGLESPRANFQLIRATLSYALSLLRSLHHSARNSAAAKTSGVFPHTKVHQVLYDLDQWLTDHLNLAAALINAKPADDQTMRAWCRTLRATLRDNQTLDHLCGILRTQESFGSSDWLVEGWRTFGDNQFTDSHFDDIIAAMDRAVVWFRSAASLCQTQSTPAMCYLPIAAAVIETRQALRSLSDHKRFKSHAAEHLDREFLERWEADFMAGLQQSLPPTPTQPLDQDILNKAPIACTQAMKALHGLREQIFASLMSQSGQTQAPPEIFQQTLTADLWVLINILRAFADMWTATQIYSPRESVEPDSLQEFLANMDRYQHLFAELEPNDRTSLNFAIETLKSNPGPATSDQAIGILFSCSDYLAKRLSDLEISLPPSVSYETKVEALARFCAGMPVHRSHSGTPIASGIFS